MIITHNITMDLACRGQVPSIDAVQDDRYCRNVALTLTAGGEAWTPPEGASVIVRYSKADGCGGEYDTLPDGTTAWSVSGNVVTVALAPQVLTVQGAVSVTVGFISGDRELYTFLFLVNVGPNAGAQTAASEDYFSIRSFLPQPSGAVPADRGGGRPGPGHEAAGHRCHRLYG